MCWAERLSTSWLSTYTRDNLLPLQPSRPHLQPVITTSYTAGLASLATTAVTNSEALEDYPITPGLHLYIHISSTLGDSTRHDAHPMPMFSSVTAGGVHVVTLWIHACLFTCIFGYVRRCDRMNASRWLCPWNPFCLYVLVLNILHSAWKRQLGLSLKTPNHKHLVLIIVELWDRGGIKDMIPVKHPLTSNSSLSATDFIIRQRWLISVLFLKDTPGSQHPNPR